MEPHEIEFLERFLDLGHRARWIIRDTTNFHATNDFLWGEDGDLACELKTTGTKLSTVTNRIVQAVTRARMHGVTKENFVVDVGDHFLRPDVIKRLADFNKTRLAMFGDGTPAERDRYVGGRPYVIKSLWIMSRGMLREVELS